MRHILPPSALKTARSCRRCSPFSGLARVGLVPWAMQASIIGWTSRHSCRLIGIVAWTLLVLTTTPVLLGQDGPIVNSLPPGDTAASQPSVSEAMVDRSGDTTHFDLGGCSPRCFPRWTASADFILLERIGSVPYTLVERVSGGDPNRPGTEVLNATDLPQGFSGGPRVGLIRHGDGGYDLELSYFQIDGWSSSRSVYPPTPQDWRWLTMRCRGDFLQLNEGAGQGMVWQYGSRLYNAELNVRWNACNQVTMLAGFRWVRLQENLQGALEPPTVSWEPPFWNTTTTNNLYGVQIGAEGRLFERGRFSIDGLVKAGIFDNNAEQFTGVSTIKVVRPSVASVNHAAFVGETGLRCRYEVTPRVALKVGYEAIWLQGVALAPGQIPETVMSTPTTAQALGVNCNSGAFYHGATAGLEYSF